MILLDANVVIYAYDAGSPFFSRARRWFEPVLSGAESVRFPWSTVLAFLRITSDVRLFNQPLAADEAIGFVISWLERPMVSVLEPGEQHLEILRRLVREQGLRGPELMDAHLAALAIENGATLCTADRGFLRFRNLKLLNPLRD